MPLFKALYETHYRCHKTGRTFGRGHDIILEAPNGKQAVRDALRFIRNRQAGEAIIAAEAAKETDSDYEAYWGELGAMKVYPWSPYIVQEDGNLREAPGYTVRGHFEWKCDHYFSVEDSIEHMKETA